MPDILTTNCPTAALRALEQCLYARFSRSRDLPRARNVPSIAGSSRVEMDVVICQEHVLCEAGRCGDANGRVVYFYLDCKTSSLSESQPYACYTIAGSLGHVTRSNKATWVEQPNAVLRVAKKMEVIGTAVTKMTNCDRARKISRANSQRRRMRHQERCRQCLVDCP